MKISGFTFLKNANMLFYPIEESILSILDLVDEFVMSGIKNYKLFDRFKMNSTQ